jgi:hypothetical protein
MSDLVIVSLDTYWTTIALPLFVSVMGFGLFVLFKLSGSQIAGTPSVLSTLATLKNKPMFFRERGSRATSAHAAPSAPPAL